MTAPVRKSDDVCRHALGGPPGYFGAFGSRYRDLNSASDRTMSPSLMQAAAAGARTARQAAARGKARPMRFMSSLPSGRLTLSEPGPAVFIPTFGAFFAARPAR
jgi:hypothetical protein